jgi:hypothetical protein
MTGTFPIRDNMMPTVSRRGFILGSASAATLALAFPLPARTQTAITVEEFRALSARLMGASPNGLDAGVTAQAARRLHLDASCG